MQIGELDLFYDLALPLILIVIVSWEIWDHPYSDKTTLFYEDTTCFADEEECPSLYGKVTFRVLPESQSVTGVSISTNSPPFALSDCIVVDKSNWECRGTFFRNHPIGKIHGKWTLEEGFIAYKLKSMWWIQKLFG